METLSSNLTLGSLLVTDAIIINKDYDNQDLKNIRSLEIWILSVAALQYLVTYNSDHATTQRWRYLDWLLTTPALLGTYYLLARKVGYEGQINYVIAFNILMVVAGYFSEYPELTPGISREMWYFISVGSLIVVLYNIYLWTEKLHQKGVDTREIEYFFYVGWSLYGLNFLTPDEALRQTIFNILDFFNKVVYTYALSDLIDREFRN